MINITPKAFAILTGTLRSFKNPGHEHKIPANVEDDAVDHGAKIAGNCHCTSVSEHIRLCIFAAMHKQRFKLLLASLLLVCLALSSCGSAKRCDCPSFSATHNLEQTDV